MEGGESKANNLRLMYQQRLTESGEKDRLMEFLRTRLGEYGYNDDLLQYCKNYIRSKGVEHVDVESLVAEVTPRAREMLPDQVKRELLNKIRQFVTTEMQRNESLVRPS